ncbi:MAG: hypothetical protein NC084_12920 [Bacteroides sp.]|nr:hypothetical protein [Eubacterium sp.]MCM1419576.1 hypothetical protein [Roseburia sp.]MCM1463597.1 hypothetical protein [Bacteroides sp.]
MTRQERSDILKEHLDFLREAAQDAADSEFYGDVPELSKQILATVEALTDND